MLVSLLYLGYTSTSVLTHTLFRILPFSYRLRIFARIFDLVARSKVTTTTDDSTPIAKHHHLHHPLLVALVSCCSSSPYHFFFLFTTHRLFVCSILFCLYQVTRFLLCVCVLRNTLKFSSHYSQCKSFNFELGPSSSSLVFDLVVAFLFVCHLSSSKVLDYFFLFTIEDHPSLSRFLNTCPLPPTSILTNQPTETSN